MYCRHVRIAGNSQVQSPVTEYNDYYLAFIGTCFNQATILTLIKVYILQVEFTNRLEHGQINSKFISSYI